MDNSDIFISVIICTYQKSNYLKYALQSLIRQTWDKGGWEVIVVENGLKKSPKIEALLENYKEKVPLKTCFVDFPNLSRARNCGIDLAKGEYAAFIDDDVEVKPLWLESLMLGCRQYRPDFCGGPSFALFKTKRPYWFNESYGTAYFYGNKLRLLTSDETIGGMNFIVRPSLVKELGGFREDLGPAGNNVGAGDETDLLERAWKMFPNLKVQYLPEAAVLHMVRPEKMTLRWQLKSYCQRSKNYIFAKYPAMSKAKALKEIIITIFCLMRETGVLIKILFLTLFSMQKTAWQCYVKENMLGNVGRIYALSLLMASSRRKKDGNEGLIRNDRF